MSEVKVRQTGCPGPIPGTRYWRCDGKDCYFSPMQYELCKQSIAERGYELILSNDLKEQVLQDVALRSESYKAQLQQEQTSHIVTKQQLVAERASNERSMATARAEQHHMAELMMQELQAKEEAQASVQQLEQEQASLASSLAELEEQSLVTASELAMYKDKERYNEQRREAMANQDTAGDIANNSADSSNSSGTDSDTNTGGLDASASNSEE